ncbi:MAG TPA: metalloprotease PmbA, partial [Albitalea sp.]
MSSVDTTFAPPAASTGFAYSRERFRELVEEALAFAKSLGASDAGAEVSEGVGLSVSVRKGEVENVER